MPIPMIKILFSALAFIVLAYSQPALSQHNTSSINANKKPLKNAITKINDPAKQWRAVCQLSARLTTCETKAGKKLFSYKAQKIALNDLPEVIDFYGVNRAGVIYKTHIDGQEVLYTYTEVSNGITMVWSDSPLFKVW